MTLPAVQMAARTQASWPNLHHLTVPAGFAPPCCPATGRCLLEWEGEGEAPLPLLKDMFASERRKAKVGGQVAPSVRLCCLSITSSIRQLRCISQHKHCVSPTIR